MFDSYIQTLTTWQPFLINSVAKYKNSRENLTVIETETTIGRHCAAAKLLVTKNLGKK